MKNKFRLLIFAILVYTLVSIPVDVIKNKFDVSEFQKNTFIEIFNQYNQYNCTNDDGGWKC